METDLLPDSVNVYSSKQRLPDGSLIVDIEYAKLEMECGYLRKQMCTLIKIYNF